jgi:hypothetical protein
MMSLNEEIDAYYNMQDDFAALDRASSGMSKGGGELLDELGLDATKWAEAFERLTPSTGASADHEVIVGWFANAIMAGYDEGTRRAIAQQKRPKSWGT